MFVTHHVEEPDVEENGVMFVITLVQDDEKVEMKVPGPPPVDVPEGGLRAWLVVLGA